MYASVLDVTDQAAKDAELRIAPLRKERRRLFNDLLVAKGWFTLLIGESAHHEMCVGLCASPCCASPCSTARGRLSEP